MDHDRRITDLFFVLFGFIFGLVSLVNLFLHTLGAEFFFFLILTRQSPLRLSRGGIGLYFGASIAASLLDLPCVNSHDIGSVFTALGHLEF